MDDISTQNFNSYNEHYIPVAVLLEGKFNSLYANRLTQDVKDSVSKALGKPFASSQFKRYKTNCNERCRYCYK